MATIATITTPTTIIPTRIITTISQRISTTIQEFPKM
jgi:hypothetical protein